MQRRSRFDFVLLCFAFVVPGSSLMAHDGLGHGPPACRLSAKTVTIPMDTSKGKVTVMASLNGKGPFKFFLDTGAGVGVCLDKKLADELGLKSTGTMPVGDPSNPSAITADVVTVETITVAGAEFKNVGGLSWDRSHLYSGEDAPRGILGFPLFGDCLMTLDYPKNEIRLENGSLPTEETPNVVSFVTGEGGIPQISVSVAGKQMTAHLDSGAMGGITIPTRMEKEFTWSSEPKVVGRGRTANSDFEMRAGDIEGTVQFAGHTLTNPKVHLSPILDRIGFVNLGSGVLKDFVVTIDSANQRMRLLRNNGEGVQK